MSDNEHTYGDSDSDDDSDAGSDTGDVPRYYEQEMHTPYMTSRGACAVADANGEEIRLPDLGDYSSYREGRADSEYNLDDARAAWTACAVPKLLPDPLHVNVKKLSERMTKFEYIRVMALRMAQLYDTGDATTYRDYPEGKAGRGGEAGIVHMANIVADEIHAGDVPFIISRSMPDRATHYVKCGQLDCCTYRDSHVH